VREEFDLSASENAVAPSLPTELSALSENEMKEVVTVEIERIER
jgi:hypothetical protein